MGILSKLRNKEIIRLDGGMGTMLQKAGLKTGQNPETLNIQQPEVVKGVHSAYFAAGSQIVYTNTFGANAHKLARTGYSVEEVVTAAVKIAREAAEPYGGMVGLDIGPLGELLEPMGMLSFDDAYELFAEQVRAGVKAGVDMIAIETMTDLYEAKAALLAVKENSDLPVFVTMSFEQDGRTFTGTSISAMALTMEGLGADAIGINCSLGPIQIYDIVKKLVPWTSLPIIVKPNAGLPVTKDGVTTYDITPEQFGQEMAKFLDLGVTIMGGCCGTNPDYIRSLCANIEGKNADFSGRSKEIPSAVCSNIVTLPIDRVRIIGERINPTGKKQLIEAIQDEDMDYIVDLATEQTEAGAEMLDVNISIPSIDEAEMMGSVIKELQSYTNVPLAIDSLNKEALEAGLRYYNGKPILNSVTGEEAVLDRLLPLAKEYGAAVAGLTMDEKGIAHTAEERFAIAEKILAKAESYGIPARDVYIDCLSPAAGIEEGQALETFRALRMVKERLGVKTILGISNVSFSMPARAMLNQAYLSGALASGLDLAIINPNSRCVMDTLTAFRVLAGDDDAVADYIERFADRG